MNIDDRHLNHLSNDLINLRCSGSDGSSIVLAASPALDLDKWYSLEVFYGENVCAFYLNNVQIDSQPIPTKSATDKVYIGMGGPATGAQGQIHIDAVRVDNALIGKDRWLSTQISISNRKI